MSKPNKSGRYTVSVGFDGVIHSYTSPWVNAWTIPDPPVDGALEWLRKMALHFDVVIFSTRCKSWRGRRAMRRWLWEHDSAGAYPEPMEDPTYREWCSTCRLGYRIKFVQSKPPALIYLDDRAVRFEGPRSFPSVDEIHQARPWNKR